jgi:phosphoribosylformylglycinamidine cyclo-ligase
MAGLTEEQAGVRSVSSGLGALLRWIRPTFDYAPGHRPTLDIGYFANVVPVAPNLGIAISTDGVGTKLLVAQAAGRFDTVGIDCVAMNVNDIVCVGARPVSLVDYIAVEAPDAAMLGPLGEGLARGCQEAGVNCPGGELAQVREMLHPSRDGRSFDLVATAIGVVPLDRVLSGQSVQAGDVLIGCASAGLHSNGFTLARRTLIDRAGLRFDSHVPELGSTLIDELLKPTRIYVRSAMGLLDAGVDVRALAHITGDGLFNLVRTTKPVGFDITDWPDPPAIFSLIQQHGGIADDEMFRAFNMGVGFCAVVSPSDADRACAILRTGGERVTVLGTATDDAERTITFRPRGLVGRAGRFDPR